MRSTSTNSSAHRREPSSGGSLPAISENGMGFIETPNAPPIPLRAPNRPAHTNFASGAPPRINYERNLPAYNHFPFNDVDRLNGEKLAAARKGVANNKHIAKRGGWRRLSIAGVIVALIIVGLVVGLVVGLRNQNKSSTSYGNPTSFANLES
jgi:hypothetical protein